MERDIELFEEEIFEIKDFSELDDNSFKQIMNQVRLFFSEYRGPQVTPNVVVDVIEAAVSTYILSHGEVSIEESVDQSLRSSGLVADESYSTEVLDLFADEDSKDISEENTFSK